MSSLGSGHSIDYSKWPIHFGSMEESFEWCKQHDLTDLTRRHFLKARELLTGNHTYNHNLFNQ